MIGIYARVSTEEQAKSGYSIQFQIREAKKKAMTNEILEYLDEGMSGEFLDRPALTKLRKDVKEGLIDKIICLDPDRLSRKLMHQLLLTDEFERRGADLIFVNGEYQRTPEGQLFYSMRGAIAEFEKAKINERMSRGRKEKARQGKIIRDFQVYGYDYDKDLCQFVINGDQAKIVQLIFDLFIRPNGRVKGINGIAHYLTDRRIPTKKKVGVWHRQVIRQILMNEAYTGIFYQNKWNTEGMLANKFTDDPNERINLKERPKEEWIPVSCPQIIDRTDFNHAQKLLKESRRRWSGKTKNDYLLSGLLRCGDCGNTMTGRKAKNWGKYEFEYTDVKNTSGAKSRGCGRTKKCSEIDNEVWAKILEMLNNPEQIAASSEEQEDFNIEIAEKTRLEKELEKIKTGRKRLIALLAEGLDIGTEEIREQLKEMKQKEEQLIYQINEIDCLINNKSNEEHSRKSLQEITEWYYSVAGEKELTFEDKKQLIRSFIREIRVFDDKIQIYIF